MQNQPEEIQLKKTMKVGIQNLRPSNSCGLVYGFEVYIGYHSILPYVDNVVLC